MAVVAARKARLQKRYGSARAATNRAISVQFCASGARVSPRSH